jgi:hypothetical protein
MTINDLITALAPFDSQTELIVQTDNFEIFDTEFHNFNGTPTLVVYPIENHNDQ